MITLRVVLWDYYSCDVMEAFLIQWFITSDKANSYSGCVIDIGTYFMRKIVSHYQQTRNVPIKES